MPDPVNWQWTEEEKIAFAATMQGAISPEKFAQWMEETGAIKQFMDAEIDQWLLEEELEFRGRWADDGGSLIEDDIE